jgi:hypothetical protein
MIPDLKNRITCALLDLEDVMSALTEEEKARFKDETEELTIGQLIEDVMLLLQELETDLGENDSLEEEVSPFPEPAE